MSTTSSSDTPPSPVGPAHALTGPRLRRASNTIYSVELNLDTHVAVIRLWATQEWIGEARWVPCPPPFERLRGRLLCPDLPPRDLAVLGSLLCRGNPAWSFDQGPWTEAEAAALAAGVGPYEAYLLRTLMWTCYRGAWPASFSEGCGLGPGGAAPLIAAFLAEPERLRARWELLLMTSGLLHLPEEAPLEVLPDDRDPADPFYHEP